MTDQEFQQAVLQRFEQMDQRFDQVDEELKELRKGQGRLQSQLSNLAANIVTLPTLKKELRDQLAKDVA